jgi:hypothetical protein
MPSRKESMRAREQLQSATPISDDASLLKLEAEAAQYVCEAKRRDATEGHEMVSSVVEAVARNYFRHALRKQRRRAQG